MLLECIEKTLATRGKHVAYVHGDRRLTYTDLDRNAGDIAARLTQNGLQPGDRVGVKLEASTDYPAVCIGVWRAGGVVVPLDAALNESELTYFVTLAQVRLIVSSTQGTERDSGMQRLRIHRPALHTERKRDQPDIAGDLLVLFTSGTTGPPKGIIHTNESAGEMVRRHSSRSGLERQDVVLASSMFNTGLGLYCYVLEPLFTGARVVIAHPFQPRQALDLALRESITWIQTVPAILQLLMTVKPRPSLPTLKTVRLGGTTLDDASRERFYNDFGVCPIQGYGMSEIGPIASTSAEPSRRWGRTVGYPEVDVRLFGDDGSHVPIGEQGEIGVRGRGLCRPFYLMEDGSREPLPMCDGYFLTGDLGRLSEDNCLELTGRKKTFILTPRVKVDPGEVEHVLLQHPEIVEATVLPAPGAAGYEIVKAVVVTTGRITKSEVLSHCGAHLAPGKCPQIVQFVDRLPRDALGKIQIGKIQHSGDLSV